MTVKKDQEDKVYVSDSRREEETQRVKVLLSVAASVLTTVSDRKVFSGTPNK